ncbi:uncharacterized protein BKA55DRAFT_568016 [Fusarium redolens]|uniref:Myb-like domain-containing protein n=1 Tax=Fusarium redolens TaxID=48865 RepID=A0A9P9H355_FUSRE|nr:uncharacterized protein BKA55DRAFT_568016 [Fusarium redolens]KAH7249816.1 hypothetical protein BKA55DRAFT_568016 [Fusarium redolens]
MNSKNWNDRADKDLFFTILSVKNIGVISGSEWTTIGNHMRSLGYGFTNEGCRQHFQGLRRAQNKAETAGPNGDIVRRNDPTMNPITRRPGPGRGRPRKQPPVPVPGAHGEIPSDQPMPVGIVPGPNPVPPYPHPHSQAAPAYGVPPGNHQAGAHLPAQAAAQPGNISPATPTQQVPPPSNTPHAQGPITYPSPPRAPDTPQTPAHLHPLQHGQSVQPGQQSQTEQQPQPGHQLQPDFQPQPDQQAEPEQASQPTAQPQPEQENSTEYQSQDVSQEARREAREATDASAVSQHAPVEQNHDPQVALTSEQLQHANEDIDADGDADADAEGDADAEADIDNDEPAAKRPRLSSPEPPKDTDMDDEAVLALAAHNGSTDFASDFATYGEA